MNVILTLSILTESFCLSHEVVKVLHSAVFWSNSSVVRDIVAEVIHGRQVDGG